MLWVELLHYKKMIWELLLSNQGPLFLKLNYLNTVIKSFLKICFWSVNLLIVSCHHSSTIGSLLAHNYETTSSATCKLFKPSFCTNLYGKNSIKINATDAWNKAQTYLGNTILKDLTPNKNKTIIMKRMIDNWMTKSFVANEKSVFL